MLKLFYWKDDRDIVMFLNTSNVLGKELPELDLKWMRKQLGEILTKEKDGYPRIQKMLKMVKKNMKNPENLWAMLVLTHVLSQACGEKMSENLCQMLSEEVSEVLDFIKDLYQ